jgi:UDP-3-O-[3-hydroxymyristoyl] glucosamine N-acyltransferase
MDLATLVHTLGGVLHGNPAAVIGGLASLEGAGEHDLSFLSHPRYQGQLQNSRAMCVIVAPQFQEAAVRRGACIVADDPYLYFARVTQLWKRNQTGNAAQVGIHPTAFIDARSQVHSSASVGPFCVVERGASVGADSVLKARVTVGENCVIGERCILHSGVVIGADGFGFASNAGTWEKIEQLGAVRIGDDVEVGANSCIDRGALQDTVIADGVKIDNLVQIGHNVQVGKHTAMAGCVGIAGSAVIGAHCTLGGGAIVLGHLRLADRVHISAASVVTRSLLKPGNYTGVFPLDDNFTWEKNAATLKQLHRLRERVRVLERYLETQE